MNTVFSAFGFVGLKSLKPDFPSHWVPVEKGAMRVVRPPVFFQISACYIAL